MVKAFSRISLARRFMLVSFGILLTGMLVIGVWVSYQIERGVLNRTAAITALYVDSFVSPQIQDLSSRTSLANDVMQSLDLLISSTALGEQIVSFKVWSNDGRILYSADRSLVGVSFEIDDELAEAIGGEVVSTISNLNKPEHVHERERWDHLIETYAPVRKAGSDEIVAVSEFYQLPADLESEIRAAQIRSWIVVGLSTVAMYALLAGMVGRASLTIQSQQSELEENVDELRRALRQNEKLRRKVQRAGARTTALNERFLRRLSSDLHDGMGQDLTLALMRLEAFRDGDSAETSGNSVGKPTSADLEMIRAALDSAVSELRSTTAGLRLPELENLHIVEVAQRAIGAFESKSGFQVDIQAEVSDRIWAMPVKITLYRVIQEALANSFRHSSGTTRTVKLREDKGMLMVQVIDDGAGFDARATENSSGLGLAGMRERVELLGGAFKIETKPGKGAKVTAWIPPTELPT